MALLKSWSVILILAIFYLAIAIMPALAEDQENSIDGTVQAGTVDNQFSITVNNPDFELPVENLTLSVDKSSPSISNIRIEADTTGFLSARSSRVFTIKFDVSENAEADAVETVTFKVAAARVLIDHPNPKLTVKFQKTQAQAPAPVLKLIKIEGPQQENEPRILHYENGAPGFSASSKGSKGRPFWGSPRWSGAIKLVHAPLQITLGEPFEFEAEVKVRTIYKSGDYCFREKDGQILVYFHRGDYWRRLNRTALGPKLLMEPLNVRVNGPDDLHAYCDPTWAATGKDKVDTLIEKDGSVSLKAIFKPVKITTPSGDDRPTREYHYQVLYQTNGKLTGVANMSEPRKEFIFTFKQKTDAQGNLHREEEKHSNLASNPFIPKFELEHHNDVTLIFHSGFKLYYDAIHKGDAHISRLPTYDWPEELKRPPRDGSGPGTGAATGGEGGTGTGVEGDGGIATEGNGDATAARDRPGPIDPNTLDPDNLEVADHIKQWINIAQPPQNAVAGSNWHYDKLGRVVGSGPGGKVIRTHDSVAYGVGTPEATVWSMRTKLDSIDHCTLEEYVVAMLEQTPISQCAGRYGALRKLNGEKLAAARSAATNKGFAPVFAPGSPARSADEEGTVEKQEPGPDQYLRKGDTIKLYVHSPYVSQARILPDFTGRSLSEAKNWLKNNQLTVQLKPGTPAPSSELTGTVEVQEPPADTQLAAGEKVVLTVHSAFIEISTVPDLQGVYYDEARRRLGANGLSLNRQDGGHPPNRSLANTVREQNPPPGTRLSKGLSITVLFYGPYVQTRDEQIEEYDCTQIPNSFSKWDDSANAPRCFCWDSFVLNDNKDACVPGREKMVADTDCGAFPGSKAYWDTGAVKPMCGCFDELQWNSSRTRCVTQSVVDQDVCLQNSPGTFPNGHNADGQLICECPDGNIWDNVSKRCPLTTTQVQPACQCRVDTALMNVAGSTSCSTFKESINQQGLDDVHGRNVVIHVVNDRHVQGGTWSAPGNWLYGYGFTNCQTLLKDERETCARTCPAGSRSTTQPSQETETQAVPPQGNQENHYGPDISGRWDSGGVTITLEGSKYVARRYNNSQTALRQGWENGQSFLEIYRETHYIEGRLYLGLDNWKGRILMRNSSGQFFWEDCEIGHSNLPGEKYLSARYGNGITDYMIIYR